MGQCCSGDPKSRAIDRQNKKDFDKERQKIKLLLLGAGESGKSTIFKQMKLLYGKGFTEDERLEHAPIIRGNVVGEISKLCKAVVAFDLERELAPASLDAFKAVTHAKFPDPVHKQGFDDTLVAHIKQLWSDPAVAQAWTRRSETQVIESAELYFRKLDDIKDKKYVPTDEDIVASRARTSGIIEEKYVIGGVSFVIIDVGGQKSERRKWIHAFDEVTAIIFVAAVSEFDQMMFEDASANRMEDALELFDKTCNGDVFGQTPTILFLNKSDLFKAKVAEKSIADTPAFGDYDGQPHDYDDGIEYFVQKFRARNQKPEREIFHHVTCAMDSKNVQVVFNCCKDIILRDCMKMSGFV